MPRPTPLRALRRPLAALVPLLLLVLAGCSGSASGSAEPAASGSAGGGFPVTLEHQFGSTTIPAAPQRVVTVGFNEQDYALALGVEPVGVREFLGYDAPNRPWAPEGVRGKEIPTLGSQDLELEKIAALAPDLILGVNSYIDQEAYDKLAAIAPTVAQSGDVALGATSWQDQTLTTGQALGREADARALVERTEAAFDEAVAANPDFAGKSAAFALGSSDSGTYSLGADDYRTGWLTELGFTVPEQGGDVSFERLDVLDADVLLVEGFEQQALDNKLFAALPAVEGGRLVDLGAFDQDVAAALGFNSPLSLPFLLDVAVPRLAAATDGDTGTTPEPYRG